MEEFNEEELGMILWGDHSDFKAVTTKEVDEGGRWALYCSQVFRQKSTNNYYRLSWAEGATECQDVDADPYLTRVYPKETLITIYTTEQD